MAGNWKNRNWGNTPVTEDNCDDLRHRRTSVLVVNSAGDPHDDSVVPRIDTTGGGAERWLKSDAKWEKRFPAGWKGIKILGAGGFGIAGHWKYVSDKAPEPGSIESQVRDIVVKQTRASVDNGLRYESQFLEELTATGSHHFPTLYGRVQRDVGTGTETAIDPHRREVHRIFLEYCPGGSLASHMQNFRRTREQGEVMPEAALWSIFHCLAKAVSVMDVGHEDENRAAVVDGLQPWAGNKGIVHFDIKPGNVLIGSRDAGEHEVWERVMIADFGLSSYMGRAWTHDMDILRRHENWGTVVFQAPEQKRRPVGRKTPLQKLDRKYGACTNIYQVGALMWAIIIELPVYRFDNTGECYISPLTGKKKFETIGKQIEGVNYYSKALRGLILECLFQVYRYRPTPSELIKRTRIGLSAAEKVGDTASSRAAKASEKSTLQQVDTLLFEKWHGPYRDHTKWRTIIPRMQTMVNRRNIQLKQIKAARLMHTAEEIKRKDAEAAEVAKAAKAAGPAKDAGPAKEAEAARVQQTPQVGTGPGRARIPLAADDRIVGTPGPGKTSRFKAGSFAGSMASLATTAGGIVDAVHPHVTNAVRNDLAPIAARGWQIGREVAGRLGLVQKRRNDEDAGQGLPKRARLGSFQGIEPPPPAPQPGDPGFLVHVKIWPGAYSSIATESRTVTKLFRVPGNCTVAMLKQILSDDSVPSVAGVPVARIKLVAKGDFAREMPNASPLAMFGLDVSSASDSGYIECFIKPAPAPLPQPQPAATAPPAAFRLAVTTWPRMMSGRTRAVTLDVRRTTTMAQIKRAVVECGVQGAVAGISELRIGMRGAKETDKNWDCADAARVSDYFSAGSMAGAMECAFRPARGVGASAGAK